MKKIIYVIFFSALLSGCVTSKQTVSKRSEKEAKELIEFANKYIGTPYLGGGSTPKGFDCSGYVQYVYKKIGYSLPRTSKEQSKVGSKVKKKRLKPGDLVFFTGKNIKSNEVGHVGIITNPNNKGTFEFIHAASTGVRIDKGDLLYYKLRYINARRIIAGKKR